VGLDSSVCSALCLDLYPSEMLLDLVVGTVAAVLLPTSGHVLQQLVHPPTCYVTHTCVQHAVRRVDLYAVCAPSCVRITMPLCFASVDFCNGICMFSRCHQVNRNTMQLPTRWILRKRHNLPETEAACCASKARSSKACTNSAVLCAFAPRHYSHLPFPTLKHNQLFNLYLQCL
jgi:hypothetical protein